jgi:hypothetical protein
VALADASGAGAAGSPGRGTTNLMVDQIAKWATFDKTPANMTFGMWRERANVTAIRVQLNATVRIKATILTDRARPRLARLTYDPQSASILRTV